MKHLLIFFILLLPLSLFAQELTYEPLVGIPGISTGADFTFNQFINSIYGVAIGIAALLAVIKIVIGGAKYMITDVAPAKGDAKAEIKSSLLGLLVVLVAVLIISVINEDILEVDLSINTAPNLATDKSNLFDNSGVTNSNSPGSAASVPGAANTNDSLGAYTPPENEINVVVGGRISYCTHSTTDLSSDCQLAKTKCAENGGAVSMSGKGTSKKVMCIKIKN